MAQANVKLTVDASQATRALQGVQTKTTKLQGAFGALKTAIAGVAIQRLQNKLLARLQIFKRCN